MQCASYASCAAYKCAAAACGRAAPCSAPRGWRRLEINCRQAPLSTFKIINSKYRDYFQEMALSRSNLAPVLTTIVVDLGT